jgi:TrmH family RNA methyltransferase
LRRTLRYLTINVVQRITSRQNPLVSRFRDVARGEVPDRMLLDGEHLLQDALAARTPIEIAAFADDAVDGRLSDLADGVRRADGQVVAVSGAVLKAISPVQQPSGVVAIAARRERAIDDVFARAPQLVVVLSDVQDPGNVGAIVRAAEGCGATGVVTAERTADPFSWKALRGGMGSTLRIPVLSRQALASTIENARARHIRVFATVPRGGTPLPEADLRKPCAILLGGEGAGLPSATIEAADARLTIPMRAGIESLNVAVAAAIVLYEASRQRME